jgi:hypothetical protein
MAKHATPADENALKALDDEYPFKGKSQADAKALFNTHVAALANIDGYKADATNREALRAAVAAIYTAASSSPKSPALDVFIKAVPTSGGAITCTEAQL